MGPSTSSPNTKQNRRMLRQEIQEVFDGSIRHCFPQLRGKEVFKCSRLEGTRQKHRGDYLSVNVLTICEGLRRLDSNLFARKQPLQIAQELLEDVMKNPNAVKMLDNLDTHDVGYITFSLRSDWMVKRIKKMLGQGIDTWAPLINLERAVVCYTSPARGADLHADEIRSSYIIQMLYQMLGYAGVAVCHSDYTRESDDAVRSCFRSVGGEIISKSNQNRLFVFKGTTNRTPRTRANNVYKDLGTLWNAINVQRGQLIVYVAPVRQRSYVDQCFAAAKTEKWLPGESSPAVQVLCCGFRTSSTEREKLETAWNEFKTNPKAAYLVRLGNDAGYSAEDSFECAVKYTYLKTPRLVECTFNIDEMLDAEGDTFVYLLKTQAIILSNLGNFASRGGMVTYTKAFVERERELEVHLVQFTEVIDNACFTFKLHLVCQYVRSLCKKFTSYYDEVLQLLDLETFRSKLFLCHASRVVLQKCFRLLEIAPGLGGAPSRVLSLYLERGRWPRMPRMPLEDRFIPVPVSNARPKHLNSRFEMFRMNIIVYHLDFEMGDIFGNVSLIDKEGLLFDERLPIDKNDNGHVTYFYHEADEAVGICRNSDLSFGNPSPPRSVSFGGDVEIRALIYAITAEKDKCFQVLNCQEQLPLSTFWDKELNFELNTFRLDSKDGSADIDYILLRDALDTSMTLRFESPDKITSLTGSIYAYYGGGVLDGCEVSKDRYKAVLFHADFGSEITVGEQKMKKSVMAVPVDGCLIIEAVIFDVKTGRYVLKEPENLYPGPNYQSSWHMSWEKCSFTLTVVWTKGPKCLYA